MVLAAARISGRAGPGKAFRTRGPGLSRLAADAVGGDQPARGGSRRADRRARPPVSRPDRAGPARSRPRPSHPRGSRELAARPRGDRQGPSAAGLRLGAIPTALPIVSQLTGPFNARFPGVSFTVLSLNSPGNRTRNRGFRTRRRPDLSRQRSRSSGSRPSRSTSRNICSSRRLTAHSPAGCKIAWSEAAACAAVPADSGHAEPPHHRRHFPLGRGEAQARGRDEFDLQPRVARRFRPMVGDRAAPAAPLLRPSAGTRAIELVEPTPRRTIGLIMCDREPPSPLARNLFAMEWPADMAALIEPPVIVPARHDRRILSDRSQTSI